MRDEDDRAALGPQAADDLVQPLDLHGRQARRRLVEDDQVGLASEGSQDLDLLLGGDGQVPHDGPCLEVEARVSDQPVEPLAERSPIDEAGALRLRAEEHVLRHGQPRDEGDLLRHERDPAHERRAGRAERDRRPVQDQVALVLREHAGDDLAQGRERAPAST